MSGLNDHGIVVEQVTDPSAGGQVQVIVRIGDGVDLRTFNLRSSDEDWRDFRIAGNFWRHAEMIAAELPPGPVRDAAILTDQCLAIERLFPHLRERLPA